MVRVNAKIASAAPGAAAQETYVITGKAARRRHRQRARRRRVRRGLHAQRARSAAPTATSSNARPGAFVDPSGNVSIGGATGLENIYIVNGINVTGIEYGNLETGTPSTGRRHQPAARVPDPDRRQQRRLPGRVRRRHGRRHQQRAQVGQQRVPRQRVLVLVALLAVRRPDPDHHRRAVARLRAQARLRHQHRRRGRRPDHQGQAVLLGRLRARASRTPTSSGRPTCSSTTRRRWAPQTRRGRQPDPDREHRTGARASPSRARPTTTPPRWTSSPAPSTT